MDALAYFSADYQEARAKFRAAARAAGAHLTAYENPAVGPDDPLRLRGVMTRRRRL